METRGMLLTLLTASLLLGNLPMVAAQAVTVIRPIPIAQAFCPSERNPASYTSIEVMNGASVGE